MVGILAAVRVSLITSALSPSGVMMSFFRLEAALESMSGVLAHHAEESMLAEAAGSRPTTLDLACWASLSGKTASSILFWRLGQ